MNLNDVIERWLISTQESLATVNRPFVTLSYAQSLDGSIALRPCEPLALSSDKSLQLTHQLRSMHDGILVGIGTVLSDDPQLTVRHWSGKNPQPIVLDSQLRMPSDARLRHCVDKPCWILTTRASKWQDQDGVEICPSPPGEDGRVCLENALALLYGKGIRHLMVEGGAHVITAFLKARLVDAIVITLVPKLVGGYKAVGDLEHDSRINLPVINPFFSERLGDDLVLWGTVEYREGDE
jgi:riboflavin-specific deaminase-like protein